METQPPKWHSPPIFDPCLLLANGWMDQDATWYGGRAQLKPHCVRWRPSTAAPARFRPMSIVAKRSPISGTADHLFKMTVIRDLPFVMWMCGPHPMSIWWCVFHCAKFAFNRYSGFDDMQVLIFDDFGLKMFIHAPNWVFSRCYVLWTRGRTTQRNKKITVYKFSWVNK